jgi:pimeloyl-ACP methyl ester carboxylesterase
MLRPRTWRREAIAARGAIIDAHIFRRAPLSELPSQVHTVADAEAIAAKARLHRLSRNWGELHWREWGDGGPVVLLHGGSGSWNHWVRNIPSLVRAGHRVLVPDLPGFGDSAAPEGTEDADALPDLIEPALDELLADASFQLLAFSFGSLVAGFLAARLPHRVRGLLLIGAGGLGIKPARRLTLRRWTDTPPGPARDAIFRANLEALMLARPESADDLALALHGSNLVRDRMRKRRLASTDILRRTLREVSCPVTGVVGEEDVLFRGQTEKVREALADAPRFGSLHVVPGAGHWAQYERPEAINSVLLEFLGR